MEEEIMNEGLGMSSPGVQKAPGEGEKYMAKPNSSLQMINQKRIADNVEQEARTETTLNGIREQAKQQLVQEMAQKKAMEDSVKAREIRAIDYGRSRGLEEGLDLGLREALKYSDNTSSPQSGASESEDVSYSQNYASDGSEDTMNDEMDYVDNSGLGRL